jgi:hypothetical protein
VGLMTVVSAFAQRMHLCPAGLIRNRIQSAGFRKFIRSDKTRCILFAFALILFPFFGLKIFAALQCYPALDGDSWLFGISAVEYERTGITRQPFITDWPNADISFFPHGYLYQIALTKLSPIFGYQGIYISNIILFSTYAILFFLLCASAAVNCIVAIGALVISISSIGPSTFRPELLAANLILVWILAMKQMESTNCHFVKTVLSACILVLLGITQPTIGVLSAAILCYWMIYERGARALLDIAFVAFLTALGIAAITEFVTGSFLVWIESIFEIGQTLRPAFSYKTLAYLSFLLVELLWIGMIPAAILVMYVHFDKLAHVENVTNKVLLSVMGAIFVIVFSCFQFIYLPTTFSEAFAGPRYFIELFIPISIVLLWRSINEIRYYAARIAFMLILFVPVVGASISVARDALVTAIDLARSDTVSFTDVREKIRRMIIDGEPLAVDGLFIPAIDGDAKSLLVGTFKTMRLLGGEISDMWGQERAKSQACVIVIKQSNTGLEAPPNMAGFTLLETTFSSPVRLLGLIFYRTPKGYNYAVYHRVTCRR